MNYHLLYCKLISKAYFRVVPTCYVERHHIVPTSLGGTNECDNIVALTIHEHLLAHILLAKMGYSSQWFAVEAILHDSLNIHSRRFNKVRWKKWLRRRIHFQRCLNRREINKSIGR